VELDIEYGDFLLKIVKLEIWKIENPKTLICAILNFFYQVAKIMLISSSESWTRQMSSLV
jgi:hypothetical protein